VPSSGGLIAYLIAGFGNGRLVGIASWLGCVAAIVMYAALGLAAGLYILVSFAVFGTLPVDDVVAYGETAIAEAARPALGDAGFVMMALAALLATTSSVNATLYASGGLTRMLAEVGQFPPVFGRRTARGAHVGLLITAALVVAIANLVDLSAIASVGSAIALAVFVLVALAGYRRRAETGASPPIAIAAIGVAAVVLVFFAVDTLRNAPATFIAIVAIGVLAVALDAIWKRHAVDPSGSARGRAEALAEQPVAERAVAHDERRAAELGEDRAHDAGAGEDHRGAGEL
jgi:amino acid transporter